jgi:putative ABC transport system permease protein
MHTRSTERADQMNESLSGVVQDLRYAARMFSKQRGFALAAILTLALGLGSSTAIFSVVYGVMLKPLPFAEPERLVHLVHRTPIPDLPETNHGPATYFVALDHHRVFEGVGAWETNDVSITGRGDPERVEALEVSHTTLPLLRVQPIRGRLFSKEEDARGSPLRVILTHGYWQRRLGGSNDVLGQSLEINGERGEVIGVLPATFKFPRSDAVVLMPMRLDRADAFHIEFDFQVLGRLKPGVTMAQANADMANWLERLPDVFDRLQLQPHVQPMSDYVTGVSIRRILWILLAAVGVVLLIACANVANLFLIRAEVRQQELATRAALGANLGRIARVLLSESVVLALAGGVLGVLLAQGGISLLRRMAPPDLPRVDEIAIDPTVLLFTLAISAVSGALFGLAAVLRFGNPNVTLLREAGRGATLSRHRHRTRNALVVSQIALALVLLIVSGLMIRTFIAMRQVNPGFTRPEEVQTFQLNIPQRLISDGAQMARTHQSIAERLAQVPGVASVGISSSITMDGEDNTNGLLVEEFPTIPGQVPPLRRFKTVAPGYFETMGNRMLAGRAITWTDIYERRPVIIVSEPLAREYWQQPARAIGKRVRSDSDAPWREIVGVVGAERDDGVSRPATPIVYWPMLNESYQLRTLSYAVRSRRVGTAAFMREVQQAVWSVNPNLPLAAVQRVDEIQARSMAQTTFTMLMLAIAAGVALLLGVVGIHGVIAYVATQRTREIGIRLALGAQMRDVRALFLRHGLWLTTMGVVVGIGASFVVTRVMSALLFGVARVDPLTYIAVSVTLTVVALVATYIPARRAARSDPLLALRADV